MQQPGVYLNRDPAILLSCHCPSTVAVYVPAAHCWRADQEFEGHLTSK